MYSLFRLRKSKERDFIVRNKTDKSKEYFFVPRVGQNYHKGFNGLRTLVVGAFHVCNLQCEHKTLCCDEKTVKEMDYNCPCYRNAPVEANPDDVLCLHNSNIIEIGAYCSNEARYPTYTAFTRYMLHSKKALNSEQKAEFWESVAFCNFYQRFSPCDEIPLGEDAASINKSAAKSLCAVIEELQPQVVYVWSQLVNEAIDSNIDKSFGLKKENLEREHSTMELYFYSYKCKVKSVSVETIRQYIAACFPQREIVQTSIAKKKNVPPLEKMIQNAIKRGVFRFDNGELVISNDKNGGEIGYILSQMKQFYTLGSWSEIQSFIVKYKSDGTKLKSFRTIHKYDNNAENQPMMKELDRRIFEIN